MLENKLGNRNSGRDVGLSSDFFGSRMYSLEDLPELFCVRYKNFRAGIDSKLSEKP